MRRMRWTKGKKALLAFTFSLTVPFSFPRGIGSGSGPPWRVEQPFFLIFCCLLHSPLELEWLCSRTVEEEVPIFLGNVHLLLADDHSLLGSNNLFFESFKFLPRFFIFSLPDSAAFDQLEGISPSIATLQHLVAAHHAGFFPFESF